MGKKRKTHSPQFKAKVALAAIQNDENRSTDSQSAWNPSYHGFQLEAANAGRRRWHLR